MRDELLERARAAVQAGRDAGADDLFASASLSRTVEVRHRDGVVEQVQESTSRALSVRLFVDGRYSTHSTNDLGDDAVAAFLRDAVALTRALQVDPDRVMPDPALYEGRSDDNLQRFDSAVAELGPDDRIARAAAAEAAAHQHELAISATGYCEQSAGWSAMVSSNGFEGTSEGTSLWVGADVTLRDADDARPEGSFWGGARHLSDVPDATNVGEQARGWAQAQLGGAQVPTVRTTMLVHPRVAGSLVSRLLGPATAFAVSQQRTFWDGPNGPPVFSSALTLRDDPFIVRGFGSRLYDSEGIAARPRTLVDAGQVRELYVDTYYGRKIDRPANGGSRSNVVVDPGELGLHELMAQVGTGLLVTSWLGGNADSTTGDFSLGLRGFVVEGGQQAQPVREMNVTGNLVTLFQRLTAVGNDPWPYSSHRVPTLVFDDVQFSGA